MLLFLMKITFAGANGDKGVYMAINRCQGQKQYNTEMPQLNHGYKWQSTELSMLQKSLFDE